MTNIPKLIHFIWVDFSNELNPNPIISQKHLDFIQRTRNNNLDYTIKIWNGYECDQFVKKYFPNKYNLYWNLSKPIMRCDLVRLMILYIYGGIYSDMDRISLKSYNIILSKYSNYDFIIGKTMIFGFNVLFSDMIFAVPLNDFVLQCINNVKEQKYLLNMINVFYTAGPNYLQNQLNKYKGPSKNITIEKELNTCGFCSCPKESIENIVSYTTCDGSWDNKIYYIKYLEVIYCNIHWIICILVLILIICFYNKKSYKLQSK
jgi:mannosyltransferase OCH1-like enzyme